MSTCRGVARAAYQILGLPLAPQPALEAEASMPSEKAEPLRTEIKVVTWNIAAINNNPFEYYTTFEGERGLQYEKLMAAVQNFIDEPGDKDVTVAEVFDQSMFTKLRRAMAGMSWEGIDKVEDLWLEDFSKRKIIMGFLKDKTLGTKRLASMPDRFTNTINCADDTIVCRPSIINNYQEALPSQAEWFQQWFKFFFETDISVKNKKGEIEQKKVCTLLQPIKRSKYPAITEDEEAISIPLQTLCQAIFDAILVHIMNTIMREEGIDWHGMKVALCESLVVHKQANVIKLLADQPAYFNADIIFLQEVAGAFVAALQQDTRLSARFHVLVPRNADYIRDQNSLILLAKDRLPAGSDVEAAAAEVDLKELLGSTVPVSDGDVCAFKVQFCLGSSSERLKKQDVILASFHGDTAGLASTPVVKALQETAVKSSCPVVIGLDANTHRNKDAKGGTKHVDEFLQDLGEGPDALKHCWGSPDICTWNTTFNARTYLQPQLNKAVRYGERHTSMMTDCNPKDYVLFSASSFELESPAVKDNTGRQEFVEGMDFPTLHFPSDHAILSASIRLTTNSE